MELLENIFHQECLGLHKSHLIAGLENRVNWKFVLKQYHHQNNLLPRGHLLHQAKRIFLIQHLNYHLEIMNQFEL